MKRPLNLLCPACHTPLPADADAVVTCSTCAAEVDVTRAGTISGRPRFVPEIDRTGTEVGGFRIEARLGGGGMGTVYRAVGADRAAVAIKFLAPALADNPDVVARFAREIDTLARLHHPAIVRVLAHGAQDGTPWFAMALVDGSDLRARIARGALPPAETAAVFGRLFAALAHAHARGVVHRDLKPANVLLGGGGAQLADFGIARLEAEVLSGPMVTRLTETATVLGTLPYMSPEQRRGGAIDRRSDLFSAGVMLYEAATGALPQGAFAPASALNRAYGRAFDRLVTHLLQAEPARRPASAAQAGIALASALAPPRFRPLSVAASAGALAVMLTGGTVGVRALLHHGGKDGGKAADRAATNGVPTAPTKAAPALERPQPPALADEKLGPSESPDLEPKPSAPATAGAKKSRLGKIKQRVVLRAVSDVKKLRAASKAAPAPGPTARAKKALSGLDPEERDLTKSGKLPEPVGAGKPVPEATGRKKAAKALPDDAQFDQIDAELKAAIPAAARVDQTPRRKALAPDGGADDLPPRRK